MHKRLMLTYEKWQTWYVAFSGGLDSTVLLHMLWQQKLPVHAIHINHQLQSEANLWAEHCAAICKQWQIPCTLKKVDAHKILGESPEAAAREARYAVFKDFIIANTVICTAHHQDDQAETVLLQLLRGAGVAGLAAMPALAPFALGSIFRPLLNYTRTDLQKYAEEHQLKWIEDPSNTNTDFDRNFLRQEIFPRLKQRWPSAGKTISRSAAHCAEVGELLKEITLFDYNNTIAVSTSKMGSSNRRNDELLISNLELLSSPRQKNLLRHWIEQCGLSLPSTVQLEQIQTQLLHSRKDANPLVSWPGGNVRRYRDHLYAMQDLNNIDVENIILPWKNLTQELILPETLGILSATKVNGQGLIAKKLQQASITIRFRHGTERSQPVGRAHSQVLKKLFQEYGIPPWERNKIPLLYCGDELAAVIGHWTCTPFAAEMDEEGWVISQTHNIQR